MIDPEFELNALFGPIMAMGSEQGGKKKKKKKKKKKLKLRLLGKKKKKKKKKKRPQEEEFEEDDLETDAVDAAKPSATPEDDKPEYEDDDDDYEPSEPQKSTKPAKPPVEAVASHSVVPEATIALERLARLQAQLEALEESEVDVEDLLDQASELENADDLGEPPWYSRLLELEGKAAQAPYGMGSFSL